MKKSLNVSGPAGSVALFAAILCAGAAVARAQTVYSTNFNSTDTVNGAPATGFVPYTSPTQPVDNLDGQNNWASTDPLPSGGNAGTATQINGGADYVGNFGTFFGDTSGTANFAGAIGGNQRNATPTTALPDVVPSAASGGVISLYHPLTFTIAPTSLVLNVDLVLTSPSTFTNRDSFSFSLQNAAGTASLISLNFTPAPGGPPAADNVTTTVGAAANSVTGTALVLNSQYHLRLVLTTGSYAGTFSDPASGNALGSFSGSLSTASITLANVARFAVGWTLASGTITNGGYTGAGDNTLAFDNLSIVPEPSTCALTAMGLLGLLASRRRKT